jgi:hypothetical protein
MDSPPSRVPRLAFLALAGLQVLLWVLDLGEPYVVPPIARRFEIASTDLVLNVFTAVDVVLGLGFVVALLMLSLAPRSARIVVLAQGAATLAALGVLLKGGARLLVSSGAFSSGAGVDVFTRFGGAAVTLADAAASVFLLLVLGRVARAAGAGGARALAIVALVILGARMVAYGLSAAGVVVPGPPETLELVQRGTYLVYETILVALCVTAGVIVTRIPDDIPA